MTLAATAAPAALAGTGTAPDGIGERKAFKFESQRIDDRLELRTNVSTGNLFLKATDLKIAGTGLEMKLERMYNSLSTYNEATGPGWLLGEGHDVRLEGVGTGSITFHAPSGYKTTFTAGAGGSYSTPPDPGIDAKLTKKADGTFELEWHSKAKYLFNAAGRWTEHRDKNGNSIKFAYDAAGHVSTVTDTRGRTVAFTYTSGRLTSVRDNAGGRTFTYAYDASGRMASSAVTAYTAGTDKTNIGVKTLYGYDASGRLNKITDPRGNATTIAYDGTTRKVKSITRVTDTATGAGPTTTFTYTTTLSKCTGETDAVRETKVDGPRADVSDITTYCLDKHDRSVTVFDAKGNKRSDKYTSNSNVAQLNDSGVAGGPAMQLGWSGEDQMNSISLPTGGQSSMEYGDGTNVHSPTSVHDYASGGSTAAPTWSYDYDDDGNLIEAKNDATSVTYRYCYNGNGTLDRMAPPALDGLPLDDNTSSSACAGSAQGNDTLFTYNTKGELTKVDPPGSRGTVTMTYDALSRLSTRTDGRGVKQSFSYDALDRITRIDWIEYSGTKFATSAAQVSAIAIATPTPAAPNGAPPDGTTTKQTWINYSFDANGNLTARSDSSGNAGFTYDALNRMTREAPESPSPQTTYTYDEAGNPKTATVSSEPAPIRYAYDSTNLVSSVTDQEGGLTTFSYNKKGLRRSTRYPNGVVMESRYDDSKRMKCTYAYTGSAPATGTGEEDCPAASTTLLTFYRYEYSKAGVDTNRRERMTERDGSVTTYDYDAIGRLTAAETKNPAGTITRRHAYTYDGETNLTKERVTGSLATNETRTQAYAADGALCWTAPSDVASSCSSTPAGATTYSYTGDGSLAGSGDGLSVGYSLRGHTVEVTPPGGSLIGMTYTDSTQDRRVTAGDQRMAYNQFGLSAQAPTNGSSAANWFVRDPQGTLVAMRSADAATPDLFYVLDGQGSVVATTDGSGALVKRYAYEPYGQEIAPQSSDRNPWRFASGYYDKASGMLKFGARYYMPSVGRWTQRDPVFGSLEDPRGLSAYAYVGGDPVNSTDLSGRLGFDFDNFDLSESLAGAAEGAVTGAAVGLITGGPAGALSGAASGAASGFATTALKQIGDDDVDTIVGVYETVGQIRTLRSIYKARDVIAEY